jgi:formylglycine-generating enzyme required for sulfatase activity
LSEYAWYCLSGNNQTVAQKLPNGFGLYDMHGNEWEWTNDWLGCSYPSSSIDPFCDTVGVEKTRKSGDWNDYPFNQKIYPRYSKPPEDRYASIGFRLARGLP